MCSYAHGRSAQATRKERQEQHMSMTTDEPTLQELLDRLAELEQAHTRLQEELTSVRATRANAEEQTAAQPSSRPHRSSRRKVLAKGLGVAVPTGCATR